MTYLALWRSHFADAVEGHDPEESMRDFTGLGEVQSTHHIPRVDPAEVRQRRGVLGEVAVLGGRMSEIPGRCAVCGRPANTLVCDMSDGTARSQSFCIDHAPREMRDAMPKTPAEEVAHLQERLALLDESEMPPELKAKFRLSFEQLIEDIEAGRRRLSHLM
jgi:hypothetical protein